MVVVVVGDLACEFTCACVWRGCFVRHGRFCTELAGFLHTSLPKARPEELQGRTTGSLAWRTERGETGQGR